MDDKGKLEKFKEELEKREIHRGEIYIADLTDMTSNTQHLMKGKRPVVILQNEIGNIHAPTVVVACVSASFKKDYPMHQNIMVSRESVIMYEQIFTIDKEKLEKKVGELSQAEIIEGNDKLCFSLGLTVFDISKIRKIEVRSRKLLETRDNKSVTYKVKVQFEDREVTKNITLDKIQKVFGEDVVDETTDLLELEKILDSVKGVRLIGEAVKG